MALITSYASLYTYVLMDLPGARPEVYLQYLQQAGREFAEQSRAFRGPLDPLPVSNYQQDYDLTDAHAYDASILELLRASINGVPIDLGYMDLFEDRYLRIHSPFVPADEETERLLKCGVTPLTTVDDWTGITDGYFTITINSSTYEVGPCDFSSAATMDDVARILQDEWRDAQEYNRNYVKWADKGDNRFLFWTDDGEISYLTAGTSGTDIAGATHLNGLTGSASIAPILEVECVLLPHMRSDILPDWALDRWGMVIAAKAVHEMTKLRGSITNPNPWYNPELSMQRGVDWRNGLAKAKVYNRKRGRAILERIL